MGKATKGGTQRSQVKESGEEEYFVHDILAETDQLYLIDWEDDRVTGERFEPTWEPKDNPNDKVLDAWKRIVGEKAANQRAISRKPKHKKSPDGIEALVPTAPVFYNGEHCSIDPARDLANIIRQAQGYLFRDGHDAWSHTSNGMRQRVLDQLRVCVDPTLHASHPALQDGFAQIKVIQKRLEQMNATKKQNGSPFPGHIFDSPGAGASASAPERPTMLDGQLADPLSGVSAKDFLRNAPNTALCGKNILWILSIGGLTVMDVVHELHAAGRTNFSTETIQGEVESELRKIHGDFAANLADFNDFRGIFRSNLGKDFAVKVNDSKVSAIAKRVDKRKREEPDNEVDAIQPWMKAGGGAVIFRAQKKRKGSDRDIMTAQEIEVREPHARNLI